MSSGGDTVVAKIAELMREAQGTLCIAVHRNADPDAVGAALGIYEIAQSLGKDARLIAPEGLEKAAKELLKALGKENPFSPPEDAETCETWFIVDTASTSQLGPISDAVLGREYVVIDHHARNSLYRGKGVVDPSAGSSSEIVALAMETIGLKPSKPTATAMLAGIIYDTRFFRLAKPTSFRAAAYLLESGADYRLVLSTLTRGRNSVPYPEKVARLKGVSRAGIYRAGDLLIAVTCIGAYEGSVLNALIDLGADIAVGISRRKDRTRVTIRSSKRAEEVLGGAPSADIASHIATALGGSGVPAAGAAGAEVRAEPLEVWGAIASYLASKGLRVRVLEEGRWKEECSD